MHNMISSSSSSWQKCDLSNWENCLQFIWILCNENMKSLHYNCVVPELVGCCFWFFVFVFVFAFEIMYWQLYSHRFFNATKLLESENAAFCLRAHISLSINKLPDGWLAGIVVFILVLSLESCRCNVECDTINKHHWLVHPAAIIHT